MEEGEKKPSTASLLYKTIHSQLKRFSFTYVWRYVLVNVKITACKHVLSQQVPTVLQVAHCLRG